MCELYAPVALLSAGEGSLQELRDITESFNRTMVGIGGLDIPEVVMEDCVKCNRLIFEIHNLTIQGQPLRAETVTELHDILVTLQRRYLGLMEPLNT